MPAEKLTRKRLIQILIMLCILIVAFTYKTCTYSKNDSNVQIIQK